MSNFKVRLGTHGHRGPNGKRIKPRKLTKDEFKSLKKEDLEFIIPYIVKNKRFLLLSMFLTILTSLMAIIPPLLAKAVIDEAIPSGEINQIVYYGGILALMYTLLMFTRFFQNYISTITIQNVIKDVREGIFKRFLGLSMDYFDENKRGELLSVVINDVNSLSQAVTSGITNLVSDIISIFGIMIVMLMLDWPLALFTYTLIPLILLSVRRFRSRIRKTHLDIREKLAEINANVEENVSGIKVVQSLAVEDRNIREFNKISQDNYKLRMKSTKLFAIMGSVVSINTYVGLAIMITIGGLRFIYGGISLGILIAFIQYSTQFLQPLWDITNLSNTFLEAGASLLHIQEYMQVPISVKETENPKTLPKPVKGEIIFDDVSFSYTDKPFMQNMNLEIKSKEMIGIVGETGAGKSTLISLLTRLYDAKEGKITIDGVDIRDISFEELRSIMAIVSQDVFLFQDTIMNNIRFGRPDATDEEVIEAAKMAQSHEFISKTPEGYNTILGNQGSGLSGGQRQLIAYARLILANPKIAILDEATSNIDSYTESIIQDNMKNLLKDCTTIIIAHRFATLHSADRLILIDDGKIIDNGTHTELFSNNEYYKELYQKQYAHF